MIVFEAVVLAKRVVCLARVSSAFPYALAPPLHIVCMYVFFVQSVFDLLIRFIAANLLCCALVTHYALNIGISLSLIQLLQPKSILDPRPLQRISILSASDSHDLQHLLPMDAAGSVC